MALSEENPVYGPFFGVMGAASAIIFSGKFCLFVDWNLPLQILIYHMTYPYFTNMFIYTSICNY